MVTSSTFYSLGTYFSLKAALMRLVSFIIAFLSNYLKTFPVIRSKLRASLGFILLFISYFNFPIAQSNVFFPCTVPLESFIFAASMRLSYILKVFSETLDFLFITPSSFAICYSHWENLNYRSIYSSSRIPDRILYAIVVI